MKPIYTGPLDRSKMAREELLAYELFCSQKRRAGTTYKVREFMYWWLNNEDKNKMLSPTVGRIDHSKPYSWDNIEVQEMADNSREMVYRTNGHIREKSKGKKILVKCKTTKETIAEIPSIRDAARFFSVSQRKIQFVIRGQQSSGSKINFILEAK